jgi:hypothetical protein
MLDTIEPRRRRLKRKRERWPKWLRSKHLIRWLYILGPLIFRLVRMFRSLFGPDG